MYCRLATLFNSFACIEWINDQILPPNVIPEHVQRIFSCLLFLARGVKLRASMQRRESKIMNLGGTTI